jgi:hypothetical protein
MSQIRPNAALFLLSQNHVANEKLLVFKTRLETLNQSGSTTRCKEIQESKHKPSRQLLQYHEHFIKQLTCVNKKPL